MSGVHAIKVDIKEIDENNRTFAAEQDEAEAAAVSGMASRCVIETTCFDAPAGYREVNLDQHPTGKLLKLTTAWLDGGWVPGVSTGALTCGSPID